MDALNLAQHLLKTLRERKARVGESLLAGGVTSMEEYRFVIGPNTRHGLRGR